MSKRTKLTIFTIVFIIIFIAIGYFIIRQKYYQLQNDLVNQYASEELILATQTAELLQNEITSIQEKLYLIAQIPEIRDGNTQACDKKLQEVLQLNTHISNIGRVGSDMRFVCSVNKALVGTDAGKLGPYISEIFNDPNHRPVMSRLIKVPNGGYAVAMHVPVYNDKNVFIGTIGGAIYFDEFNQKFRQSGITENGYTVLQDDDGTIFYHPQANLIGQNRRPKNPQEEATASAITKLIIKGSQDGSSDISRYVSSLDNKEKVGAFAPIKISDTRRWMVIVTVPIEDILAKSLVIETRYAFFYILLLVLACVILLPLFLLIYLNFSVFNPIAKIGKAASEVGAGNLDVEIPSKGKDEIGQLAVFISDMVDRLKEAYENLEQKVTTKTQQLTQKLDELEKNKLATLNILEDLNSQKLILANKEAQLQLAQKIAHVGSFNIELPSMKLSLSPEMYVLFGLPPQAEAPTVEKFIGNIYPDDQPKVLKLLKEIIANPKSAEAEYRVEIKDQIHWQKAIANVEKDQQGNPLRIVGTARDITEERRLEQLKDEFVSVASHELRTPMTAINGIVSMMLEGDYGKINQELTEPLQDIAASTKRLISLVNDMLNVSRIEAGRMKIELSDVKLEPVLQEMVNSLQSIAKQKKITLATEKLDPVTVQADSDKVKQILNNLIGNALKFTDQGSIKLTTHVEGELVKVYVTDTGMGIDKTNQAKLFGKFQQITSQQAGKPAGTGLGLFISRELARKMGGDLWIEKSDLNSGSTFAFSLPLAGTSLAKQANTAVAAEAHEHPDQKSG